MKKLCLIFSAFSIFQSKAQNVGIGTISPSEKLDVNGNINLSGTIKTNGTSGQNGQVLMSTGAGLTWGSLAGFKHTAIFTTTGAGFWTVPAGITEIMIEAWGAGAGGTTLTGGSSGGYARTTIMVTPGGTVTISVGSGSSAGVYVTSAGGNTTAAIGGITLSAFGASGSDWSNNSFYIGYAGTPGSFSISPSTTNLFGLPGLQGGGNNMVYQEYSTGNFSNITYYGCGAASVGLMITNNNPGDMTEYRGATFTTGHYSQNTHTPGGGGAGGTGSGYNGGNGMVLIWYN